MQEQQFEAAYTQYFQAIFRYCYFRTRDRERAKDLAQEAFMKAWKYAQEGNQIDSMQAFLYKVARNLVLNEVERRKVHSSLDGLREEGFDAASSDVPADISAEAARVLAIAKDIGPEFEEALRLRYADGLTIKEIAEITGEQESTVSVRIHRGMKKLKEMYS